MIKTLAEPEAENWEDGGAFLDGFLSTHTLFVTTKEEGRTGLHWCQPISRTAAFLGATISTGARSQHLRRKSRGLLPAGSAGRLRSVLQKRKKETVYLNSEIIAEAAALWSSPSWGHT